jgi:hypothetical protein
MTITQDFLIENQHYIINTIKEDDKGKEVNVVFVISPIDKSVNDENGQLVFRFNKVPLQLIIRYQYINISDVNTIYDAYLIKDIAPKDIFSAPSSAILSVSSEKRFKKITEAILVSWYRL